MLCEPGHIVGVGLEFSDEVEDCEVEHMLQLIAEDYPFEHKIWHGGVTASEAGRKEAESSCGDSGENESAHRTRERSAEEDTKAGRRAYTEYDPTLHPPHLAATQAADKGESSHERDGFIRRLADEFEARSQLVVNGFLQEVKTFVSTEMGTLKMELSELMAVREHDLNT
uniref:Uncharacterized protein n=1 Tax=Noccaea caerulescens TaxID=107243 RepID=A0A1J3GGS0_NOCCA